MTTATIGPMLATDIGQPQAESLREWVAEQKFDGVRCIATVKDGACILHGRSGKVVSASRAQQVVRLLCQLSDCRLDGELVNGAAGATYHVFDILSSGRRDVRGEPLSERRKLLLDLVRFPAGPVQVVAQWKAASAGALIVDAQRNGWEGLVFKRAASLYCAGRSANWAKLKLKGKQEFAIVGYEAGGRNGIKCLLLATREDERWVYAGAAGNLNWSDAKAILKACIHFSRPLCEGAKQEHPDAKWLMPDLVVEVQFLRWSAEGEAGRLVQPVMKGRRFDKKASDVRRDRISAQ